MNKQLAARKHGYWRRVHLGVERLCDKITVLLQFATLATIVAWIVRWKYEAPEWFWVAVIASTPGVFFILIQVTRAAAVICVNRAHYFEEAHLRGEE